MDVTEACRGDCALSFHSPSDAAAARGMPRYGAGDADALPGARSSWAPAPSPMLEEREAVVLDELAREGEGHVSFSGLRRRLGVHQQVLTRTLRRLERDGLVERDEKGYHPTERGHVAAARAASVEMREAAPTTAREAAVAAVTAREVLPVVQALLPPDVEPEDVALRLSRRWFQGLRWYGESHAPGETTLTWLTDEQDSLRVRVRVAGATLTVECELPSDGAEAAGFPSLRALVAAISEFYGGPDRAA